MSELEIGRCPKWIWDGWYAISDRIARLKRAVRAERESSSVGSADSDGAHTFSFTKYHGDVELKNQDGRVLPFDSVTDLPINQALLIPSGDHISSCRGPKIRADRPVPFNTGEQSVLAFNVVDFEVQGCRVRVIYANNRGRPRDEGVYFIACSRGPTGWTWEQAIPALEQAGSSSTLCAELADDVRTLRNEECIQTGTTPNHSILSTFNRRGKSDACYVSAEAVDSGIVFITNCHGCSSDSMENCCTKSLIAAGVPTRCIFSSDEESGRSLWPHSFPGYDPDSLRRMGYRKVDMSWVGSMKDFRHVNRALIPPWMLRNTGRRLYITGGMELTTGAVLQATARVTVRCLRDLSRAKATFQANPRLAADAFCLLPVDAEMQNWIRSNADWIEQIPVPSYTGRHWLKLGVKSKSEVLET